MDRHLQHHGIKGQKWGVRNGPPYPLDQKNKSRIERVMGNNKKIGDISSKPDGRAKKGLTDKQKKALAIIGGTVLAGVAAYGVYTYVKANPEAFRNGKRAADTIINDHKDEPVEHTSKDLQDLLKKMLDEQYENTLKDMPSSKENSNVVEFSRIRRLPKNETLLAAVMRANPLGKDDNCTACSISTVMRMLGYDVTAKDCHGQDLYGMCDFIFKKSKPMLGSAVDFSKSPEKAASMLISRFGNNAKGVCGVKWKGEGMTGHAFTWVIENGIVTFADGQTGKIGSQIDYFWKHIDPMGELSLCRLDNVMDDIDVDELERYVKIN